jgi:hypothetical protein
VGIYYGHWIVTFEANGEQVHNDLVLHRNYVFESGDETGHWDYSPDEGKLTLADWLVITIESQEGNAFVGHGQIGYAKFPVRLAPK